MPALPSNMLDVVAASWLRASSILTAGSIASSLNGQFRYVLVRLHGADMHIIILQHARVCLLKTANGVWLDLQNDEKCKPVVAIQKHAVQSAVLGYDGPY